jgi:NhaP-type Na+/H+ or K+/H+ antiporter
MNTLSAGQMMLAAGLIFGIATLCQVAAPLLRIPALILLLPAGFVLGLAAPDLRANAILGSAFPVVVDLVVAVILFQGGMQLGTIKLPQGDKSVVRRLIWVGAPITGVIAAVASHYLLDLSWQLAALLGAIVIVSGPTVVTPILDFVRVKPRPRGILLWEGTSLDPIGAIAAVAIYQVIRAGDASSPVDAFVTLFGSFAVAAVFGALGLLLVVGCNRLVRGNGVLGTQVMIGTVVLVAGLANYVASGSGLLAALLMGIGIYPLAKRLNASLDQATPFFDTVTSIGIGVLFISIAAIVPSPLVSKVAIPAIGVALILIIVARPLVSLVCTGGAGLTGRERAFIGWVDPRGIVAAATASSLGASLVVANVAGAEKLLPAVFIIITVTVGVYGLTAVPVAQALGLREPQSAGGPVTSGGGGSR